MKIYQKCIIVVFAIMSMLTVVLTGCGGGESASTYGISGTVTSGDAGLEGVTMALTGAGSATATTDTSGNYAFSGLANGSYTVTPSKAGYTFNPVSKAIEINGANSTNDNFTATANETPTYGISGAVTSGGAGLSGVTMTLSDTNSGTVTTDASGNYAFTGLANGSYTITPSKSGYSFTPSSSAQTVNGADITGVNFTAQAIPATPMLSGTVASGSPIASKTITLKDKNGASKTAVTGTDGKYTVDVTDMTAPFLLKVTSGTTSLYSTAAALGTANIHPFTDLIIRNWYKVKGGDVDTDFGNGGALSLPPTASDIATIEAVVRNILRSWFAQAGLDVTSFNLITSPFNANNTGFDKILDNTKVEIDNIGQVSVTTTDPNTGIGGTTISTNISTNLMTSDTTRPTDPSDLAALAADASKVILIWDTSTDNIGVAGYNIYRDSNKIGTSPYPVYSDAGLTAGNYCYRVEAFDGAGNKSANKSAEACATTLASADTTAPSAPGGLTATAGSSGIISLVWNESTDDTAVLGYQVFRGTTKIATVTSTSHSDAGLAAGTNYCYTVKAFDTAMHVSAASSEACATTQAASAPVTKIWKATMPGTVFNGESSTGRTTYFTVSVTQSGTALSGTLGYQDTMGRSGATSLSGVISGTTYTVQTADFDPACASRTVTATGTVGSIIMTQTLSAPAGGSCPAYSNFALTYTRLTPVSYAASGTYSYVSSSGTLTTTWTSSNFPLDGSGPGAGGPPEQDTATVTSTTMTMASDGSTWTRASGTAGDIVGTWTTADPSGNTYQMTFNFDGTMILVGYIVSSRGNFDAPIQYFSDTQPIIDGYWATPRYSDPNHTANSVIVTGPTGTGISGSMPLYYSNGEWGSGAGAAHFGSTPPALPLTYTFTVSEAGGTRTGTATAVCFIDSFVTSPTVTNVAGDLVFSWGKIYPTLPQPNINYMVVITDLTTYDTQYWFSPSVIDGTTVTYANPTNLTVGTQYHYFVMAMGSLGCSSLLGGTFTY